MNYYKSLLEEIRAVLVAHFNSNRHPNSSGDKIKDALVDIGDVLEMYGVDWKLPERDEPDFELEMANPKER